MDPFQLLRLQYSFRPEEYPTNELSATGNDDSITYTGKRKDLTCHICLKKYVNLKSYRRHLLQVHNMESPEEIIRDNDSCETELEVEKGMDLSNLLQLQYSHKPERNSPNNFGETENDDSLTYTGKRKGYTCHICMKEYVDLKSIRRHLLRIHNIEPPEGMVLYECLECLEKFSDKSHLERHTLKHTGARPHICEKCNKGFSRKEHLTRHLLKVKCDEVKVKKEPAPEKVKKKSIKIQSPKEEDQIVTENKSQSEIETDGPQFLTILKVESAQTVFPECNICSKKFVHQ